eukprot:3065835-Pyramimonas_sp.AAC.1
MARGTPCRARPYAKLIENMASLFQSLTWRDSRGARSLKPSRKLSRSLRAGGPLGRFLARDHELRGVPSQ